MKNDLNDKLNAPPKIKGNRPSVTPSSGHEKDFLKAMMYKVAKGEDNKPFDNMEDDGLVLYSTVMEYEKFIAKYEGPFIGYCLKQIPGMKTTSDKSSSKISVLESIVFVSEACAILPQPESDDFFKNLKNITNPLQNENPAESLRKASKGKASAKLLRDIKRLERYPRVYSVFAGEQNIRPFSMVRVRFPYSYDLSKGIVISIDSTEQA